MDAHAKNECAGPGNKDGEIEAGPLGFPVDWCRPLFIYGTLMKGQPGFHQLEKFDPNIRLARVKGRLAIRDGLPLLHPGAGGKVAGQLLTFSPDVQNDALRVICAFEPRELYEWCAVDTDDGVRANALKGINIDKGGVEYLDAEGWELGFDPVFSSALNVVESVAQSAQSTLPFTSVPGEALDWERAFRLQMAYLLLWSIIERFSTLALGVLEKPTARVTKGFGRLKDVDELIREAVPSEPREIFDSRDPGGRPIKLMKSNPVSAMKYYYAVRSNLSHRGKGAWKDANTVRLSLNELKQVMSSLFRNYCGA